MIAAEDIVIDQIRVRAKPRDAQMIVNDLQSSSWSVQPRYDWVFVRKISVTSAKNEIRRSTSQAVDQALSKAVDGRLSDAQYAGVVYFESFQQLLTFLLRDLVYGDAINKWYWQRWENLLKEPKSQAINHLIWENAKYLPAVSEELASINLLAEVWQNLSDQAALHITEKLLRSTQSENASLDSEFDPDAGYSKEISLLAEQSFKSQSTGLSSWVRALSTLSFTDARYQLAAIISSIQFCPLLLGKDRLAVEQGFDRFIQSFKEERGDSKTDSTVLDSLSDVGETEEKRPSAYDENEYLGGHLIDKNNQNKNSFDNVKTGSKKELYVDKTSDGNEHSNDISNNQGQPENQSTEVSIQENTSEDSPQNLKGAEVAREATETPDQTTIQEEGVADTDVRINGYSFNTSSGGLFYLINALNQRNVLDLLNKEPSLIHPNGWLWLFDMARRLGADLDFNLLQFIADQSGLENIKELLDIPPLVELDKVESILAKHYLNEGFWDETLINIPANIVSSASHIDIFFPLESVMLPVRLAGLDINPGWMPWLGRVVTLHYRDSHHSQDSNHKDRN